MRTLTEQENGSILVGPGEKYLATSPYKRGSYSGSSGKSRPKWYLPNTPRKQLQNWTIKVKKR